MLAENVTQQQIASKKWELLFKKKNVQTWLTFFCSLTGFFSYSKYITIPSYIFTDGMLVPHWNSWGTRERHTNHLKMLDGWIKHLTDGMNTGFYRILFWYCTVPTNPHQWKKFFGKSYILHKATFGGEQHCKNHGKPTDLPWGYRFAKGMRMITQTCTLLYPIQNPHGFPSGNMKMLNFT